MSKFVPNFNALNNNTSVFSDQKDRVTQMLKNAKTMSLPISQISLDEKNVTYNTKDTIEDIEELAVSIDRNGLLNPILVEKTSPTTYVILAGERRFRAVTEILKWKKVDCKIFENLTEIDRENIINDTNLLQRQLDDETMFKGYMRKVKAYENNAEFTSNSNSQAAKDYQLSRRKAKKYKDILDNVTDEQIEQFEKGELSITSLEDIAKEQKAVKKQTERLNNAVAMFAQARENVDSTLYVDNQDGVYRVAKDEVTGQYVVRYKNFTNDRADRTVRASNLSPCDDEKTMQILLDVYAMENGLSKCDETEYIKKIKDSFKSENDDNTKQDREPSPAPFPKVTISPDDTVDDIRNNYQFTDDTEEQEEQEENTENVANVTEDITDNVAENAVDNNSQDNNTDEQEEKEEYTQDKISEVEETPAFNPIDFEVVGRDLFTGKVINGNLLMLDGKPHIVTASKIYKEIDKNGAKIKVASCTVHEVAPQSITSGGKNV